MKKGMTLLEKRVDFDAGSVAGTAGTDIDAYTYLRGVWNDPMQPDHVKLRAAQIGIEYEKPRLAMAAVVGPSDFAARLDRIRQQRIERMRLIEAAPVEEGTPLEEAPKLDPLKRVTDPSLPFTDRRFRRRV